ncbi:hypothetical protein ElyMa_002212100 [Elysia marginata]|uniref:Uncharacterized protein n=1 Tax=Elysia marginata TaxID=1093978 RepID=A0AAV4FSR5_9GAST|nr:hypothetical protein ElyMa_002212100 [Elysia marginata]
MRYRPVQEDEVHRGENPRWLVGEQGLFQPIVHCKINGTYGLYYVIRYRRLHARSLMTIALALPQPIKVTYLSNDLHCRCPEQNDINKKLPTIHMVFVTPYVIVVGAQGL